MNMSDESSKQPPPLFDKKTAPSVKDEAINTLQQNLQDQIDKRKEERFYWVFALLIGVDSFTFPQMHSGWGPFFIFVLELMALICLGQKWGVDGFYTVSERFIGLALKWLDQKNKT